MAAKIKVDRLSRVNIELTAGKFISTFNPEGIYPIEIELIAEKNNIRVTPIPNLKNISGVEGFIKPDQTEIVIDEWVYFNYPNRARFTIAHEVGHLVLHSELYKSVRETMNPSTFDEYAEFLIEKIPSDKYQWVEWQAYEFAGQILVPKKELKEKLYELINSRKSLMEDVALPIIEELSEYFGVSSRVVEIRIKNENLVKIITETYK